VKVSDYKHGLVVPTLTNFEGLAELFASVDRPVHPFVIPNWREKNCVAASWNKGIAAAEEAGCDVIHVINDDAILLPGCLEAMGRKILLDGHAVLVSAYETPEDDHMERKLSLRASYACFAVGRGFLALMDGGFDEDFSPAYFEDDDMKYRLTLLAKKRGHQVDFRVPGATYRHKRSSTQMRDPENPVVSPARFMENKAHYVLKWGGPPEHERHTTPFGE
jgi:hypothetical protein